MNDIKYRYTNVRLNNQRVKIHHPFLFALMVIFFQACIVEYVPTGIEEVSDLLIVDGTITDNESVFKLGRSIGLTEDFTGNETVNNASLFIETEDGERMDGVFRGKGLYVVPTGTLDVNKKYRLRISVEGEEYESTFLSPLLTPEIDSISPMKKGKGEPVFMCVNTHDPLNQSRYFRWSYKEHWEVKAELYANAELIDGVPHYFDLYSSNNIYYCWGKDSSRVILLASSEKLSENIISQKRLVEIPCDDDKLSILYYIAVEQIQLRKESYDYFNNLQKNIEQTGSIFTPIPSEMKGNIRSATNPDLPVIGYIEVSTTTRKDLYIPEKQGLYEEPRRTCSLEITDDPTLSLPLFQYNPPEILYAPTYCIDCRSKKYASKNKPDFWPTDHL